MVAPCLPVAAAAAAAAAAAKNEAHPLDPNPVMQTKLLKQLGDHARYCPYHARYCPYHARCRAGSLKGAVLPRQLRLWNAGGLARDHLPFESAGTYLSW